MPAVVEIQGLEQLRRDMNRGKRGASKAVGQAHKRFTDRHAARINAKADARAVGTGRGAKVRGSGAQREAKIRAGGSHRAGNVPYHPWGARQVREPGGHAPRRPYIVRELDRNKDELYADYLDELESTLKMELS